MNLKPIIQLAGIAFCSAFLVGCALSTAQVKLNYEAPPGTKTPLSDIKPMTCSLKVEDSRGAGSPSRVGQKSNGFGPTGAGIETDKDIKQVVFEAIKSEFEACGHKIVTGDAPADVTLTVSLKRYWTEAKTHFWDVEVLGTVSAELAVTGTQTNVPPFTRTITGTFRSSNQLVTDGDYEKALNGALAEFIREMALDSQLAADLRRRVATPAP
jgi:uncharacterized lipoprotein YajG